MHTQIETIERQLNSIQSQARNGVLSYETVEAKVRVCLVQLGELKAETDCIEMARRGGPVSQAAVEAVILRFPPPHAEMRLSVVPNDGGAA